MNRMYMRCLQLKLVKAAITLHSKEPKISGTEADALESTLRTTVHHPSALARAVNVAFNVQSRIVQAVQDQEYMAKHSRQRNDPFIASSERLQASYILEREMTRQGKTPSDFEELKASAIPRGLWEKGSKSGAQPLYATRAETTKRGW